MKTCVYLNSNEARFFKSNPEDVVNKSEYEIKYVLMQICHMVL